MEKEKIRALIISEIANAKEKISLYEGMTAPISPENAIGRVSRMDAINNRGVALASLQQAKIKLSRLEASFKKIDTDGFGFCAKCKRPININRVMLLPENPYCIRCAG